MNVADSRRVSGRTGTTYRDDRISDNRIPAIHPFIAGGTPALCEYFTFVVIFGEAYGPNGESDQPLKRGLWQGQSRRADESIISLLRIGEVIYGRSIPARLVGRGARFFRRTRIW